MFFEPFSKEGEIVKAEGQTFSSITRKLNNFYCHFTSYRDRAEKQMDRGFQGFKYPKLIGPVKEEGVRVTLGEFYKDLEESVKETGTELAEIRRTVESYFDTFDEEISEKLWSLSYPVYVAMRNKGYGYTDLCR